MTTTRAKVKRTLDAEDDGDGIHADDLVDMVDADDTSAVRTAVDGLEKAGEIYQARPDVYRLTHR